MAALDPNPLRLDPVQRVIDVKFDTITHLAFALTVQRRSVVKDYPYPFKGTPDEDTGGEQPFDFAVDANPSPLPGGLPLGAHYYVTGFQYEYAGLIPHTGYGLRGGTWETVDFDAVPSSLPALPIQHSIGAWSWLADMYVRPSSIFSRPPRAEYQALSGAAVPDIAVPEDPATGFIAAGSVVVQMRGTAFTSGPNPGSFADTDKGPADASFFNVMVGDIGPANAGTFAPETLDFSGVVVRRHGKAYRAAGLALKPLTGIDDTTAGSVWVLCQRSRADDL